MLPKSLAAERSDRGAVAVEFALVLPLLIVLVIGIIDFGRYLNAQVTLAQVAREGARLEALNRPDPVGRAEDTAPTISTEYSITVSVTQACPEEYDPEADAVVTARINFDFSTLLLDPFIGTRELSAEGVMPCEA